MTIDDFVRDMHALEADLENNGRKYGILSETFYEAYSMGEEPRTTLGLWIGAIGREGMEFGCAVVSNIKT